MKKLQALSNRFFGRISSMNLAGILKFGLIYEPIPPQQRDQQLAQETKK
ncbi:MULTISPECIES: hypothetical protein [Brevibacillus]|nr:MULTISPECIES: hypothetical protein [Brevibacillus]MCM3079712.1 hypothetical protein [Brevibacillus invocatus]MCM3431487.1 hypothetical protein [Brevibacillus invocatus]MDH4618313.1 hypothetical protein [Brevibacillus sp. AY1]